MRQQANNLIDEKINCLELNDKKFDANNIEIFEEIIKELLKNKRK